jgi:hypothetical protein
MSYHCSAGQNHRLMTANWSSENMSKLNIWEWQIKNCIYEGRKRKLKSENACYYSVPNHLFCLFIWVWNLVFHMKERNKLRVFENRSLRRIFRPNGLEATRNWTRLHGAELHNLYASQSIIFNSKGFWWWCITFRITEFLDLFPCPVF